MTGIQKNTSFAVLGLGRFGVSIVQTLSEYDVNILAVDRDESRLHMVVDYATHIVKADVSDESVLLSLGLGNFEVVILAMGERFETSLIATMLAKEQGAKRVIVKGINLRQKKILESVGADEVILPEHEMGRKVARRLVSHNILDILDESDYYTISEMKPLAEWVGKSIRQADIRRTHGLVILGVRREAKMSIPPSLDRLITEEDVLITLSEHKKAEQ